MKKNNVIAMPLRKSVLWRDMIMLYIATWGIMSLVHLSPLPPLAYFDNIHDKSVLPRERKQKNERKTYKRLLRGLFLRGNGLSQAISLAQAKGGCFNACTRVSSCNR